MKQLDWREQAACRDTDPGLFFPDSEAEAGPALEVCARCPVRGPCLEWALDQRETHGIWGGTTEAERRRMLRRRRKVA